MVALRGATTSPEESETSSVLATLQLTGQAPTPQPFFSFSLPGIESNVLSMLSYNPSLSCLSGLVSTFYFVIQSRVLLSDSVWPLTHPIVQQSFELAIAFQVARIKGLYHQVLLPRKLFGPECQICWASRMKETIKRFYIIFAFHKIVCSDSP